MKMCDNKLQLQTTFELVPSYLSAKFIKMRLRVCHDGLNRNRSAFSLTGFELAKPSIYNTPILGHVLFDEEGQPQFGGHDIRLEEDADGKSKIFYEEVPIGVIPEDCNYSIEEYKGRNYVCVDALIWREYANEAEQIVERDKDIQLSMEVDIQESEYDSRYGVFNVTKYIYKGVTFLGNDHTPAMAEAGGSIAQYTQTTPEHFNQMWFALQSELNNDVNETEASTLSEKNENSAVEETTEPTTENESAETTEETTESPAEENTAEEIVEEPQSEHSASDVKEAFSLLSNIVENIKKSLSEYTSEFEGLEYPKYCFEDIDTDKQLAYVYSMEDGYYYSVPYSIEGDSVTLVRNFKRQVLSFRDYIAGQDAPSVSEGTRNVVSADAYAALSKSYSDSQKELEELRAFQAQVQAEQKKSEIEAVFAKFEDLASNEEFKALKEKAVEFEIADLEKECFAIRGKAAVPQNFSFNTHRGGIHVPVIDIPDDTPKDRVAAMIQSFKNKKG